MLHDLRNAVGLVGSDHESPQSWYPEDRYNESVLGTGFWFLGEWVHSPVDIRKEEADRFDNMIDVMSKTFLGVTVSCARCHDHKFDAISTADYYSLSGFLQSSDYRQVRFESLEHNHRIADELAALKPIQSKDEWVNLNLNRYVGHRLHLEFTPADDAQLEVSLITQGATQEIRKQLSQRELQMTASVEQFAESAERLLASDIGEWVRSWGCIPHIVA